MVDDDWQILYSLNHQIAAHNFYIHTAADLAEFHLALVYLFDQRCNVDILFLLPISVAAPFHSILRRLLSSLCLLSFHYATIF